MLNDPVESVWTDVGDAEVQPPEWLVENILPVGLTLLTGPPKSYKSAVELALIMSVSGIENSVLPAELSKVSRTGRVLALSMEAEAGVLRHTAKEGFGIDIPNDGRFRACNDPWRFRLDNPADMRELLEWAETLDADLLAIDPLRNTHSIDENDSGGMIQMLQPLQHWATVKRKSALMVHHTRKLNDDKDGGKRLASSNDIRGTSALLGMADASLSITAKNNSGLIHIDALFKRGEAWQRTIQLGIWGKTGVESIDAQTKMVFELMQTGLAQTAILAAMKISKAEYLKAVAELKRLGALTGDGLPTSQGRTLVESAVRKYASST